MIWKNDQVSEKETRKILELAKLALQNEGDFVEMGCYKGDTSLMLADAILGSNKKLWIYDSFEGLPEKSKKDSSALGEAFQAGKLATTKREVKARFLKAGLPVPVIKKGWFKDLKKEDLPERIALAFLDGDFYESIWDSLRAIEPKITKESIVIVHDYANSVLPGVNKAVNEWLLDKKYQTEQYQSMLILKN